MKNILLVCLTGISSRIMLNRMKERVNELEEKVNIHALSASECPNVIDEMDIVLICPQVRYQKRKIEELTKGKIPVEVIDIGSHGIINAKEILDYALNKIK